MRRAIVVSLVVLCLFAAAAQSRAASISVGANGWCNWWLPAWSDGKWTNRYYIPGAGPFTGVFDSKSQRGAEFSATPGYFVGPTVSASFLERWKLTTSFLYGRFDFSARGMVPVFFYWNGALNNVFNTLESYSRSITRLDSDSALAYSLGDYFSVVLGFKVQYYSYDDSITTTFSGSPNYMNYSYEVTTFGPALGFALTVPLAESLYLVWNLNGVIMAGRDKVAWPMPNFINPHGRFVTYGGTSQISLGYDIAPASTTLFLGFRYQALYYSQKKGDVAVLNFDGKVDHIYGITFSAVYTFNL
jgi:hypothetical protein